MSKTPDDLKYTKTHEWIRLENEEVTLGITEHAQELLGDLVFVELPEVGNNYSEGDEIGVVESVKAASDFYSPVTGEVIEVNQAVADNPAVVNEDPYGEGWLVKLKIDGTLNYAELMDADKYKEEIIEDN